MTIEQEKQLKYDTLYMDLASRVALMSYARRKQVGCIIIKDTQIISHGWNGTPSGDSNDCEHVLEDGTMITKPEVLHAEENALDKLTKSTFGSENAIMYLTVSPCLPCAKRIQNSGIKEVVYKEYYPQNSQGDGVPYLIGHNVKVRLFNY